jgi:anion transporter
MSQASITLLILAIAIVLFVSEKLSLAVTAVGVSMALYLARVISVTDAFSGFVNSSVILFVGMFVVGDALFSTGVATKAGSYITKLAGGSERGLMTAIMVLAAVMSAALSNTSTTAVLMPVTIGIAAASGIARGKLLMPLAFAAGLGGMITLAGTPPNAIVRSVLEGSGLGTFGFFEFGLIGVPLTIAGILYMVTVGYRFISDRTGVAVTLETTSHAQTAATVQPIALWKQWVAIAVFVGTIAAMVFERRLGVPIHVSAVIGAWVLVASGVLSDKQAYQAIDWGTIFLFAGMLPMATALDRSGAGKLIADSVVAAIGQGASPYLITAVIFLVVGGLTQFMSNTAAAAVMAPLALVIASGLGADPRAVLMTVGIAASCAFATPVGTPPNTLVVGPGKFRFLDYTRAGLPLVLVMFVVSVVLIPMIWPFFP